jgi:hypothetical protein
MTKWHLRVEDANKTIYKDIQLKRNGEMVDSFPLSFIDYYTSRFKNQEALASFLVKNNLINFNPGKIYLSYEKGNIKKGNLMQEKKPIIYCSGLVMECAESIVKKKPNDKNKLIIDNSINNYDAFINKILYVLTNDNSSSVYQDFKEKNNCFHIIRDLNDYIRINRSNFKSPNDEVELSDIKTNINKHFRDYNNFRKLFLWYNRYETFRLKRVKEDLEEIKFHQQKLDEYVKVDNIEEIKKPIRHVEISNPEIEDDFNHNEDIMEKYDLDDLNKLSAEEKEKMGLGYLKR